MWLLTILGFLILVHKLKKTRPRPKPAAYIPNQVARKPQPPKQIVNRPVPQSTSIEFKTIEFTSEQIEQFLVADQKVLNSEDLEAIRKQALKDFDDGNPLIRPEWNLDQVFDRLKVGELVYDYEDSMHGDARICRIILLSKQTAVLEFIDHWDECFLHIVPDWTSDRLIELSVRLLEDGYDDEWQDAYSPWDDYEWEGEELTVRRTGMQELKTNLMNYKRQPS